MEGGREPTRRRGRTLKSRSGYILILRERTRPRIWVIRVRVNDVTRQNHFNGVGVCVCNMVGEKTCVIWSEKKPDTPSSSPITLPPPARTRLGNDAAFSPFRLKTHGKYRSPSRPPPLTTKRAFSADEPTVSFPYPGDEAHSQETTELVGGPYLTTGEACQKSRLVFLFRRAIGIDGKLNDNYTDGNRDE